MVHELDDINSSLLKAMKYDTESMVFTVWFRKYWIDKLNHYNVSYEVVMEFLASDSQGKYYIDKIKPFFKSKKSKMAEQKEKEEIIWIDMSIDVTKIVKEWLQVGKEVKDGHTPIYANIQLGYKPNGDAYGNHGMVTLKVPKDVWKADKTIKGPILGNGKVWPREPKHEVGAETGVSVADQPDIADDLPF